MLSVAAQPIEAPRNVTERSDVTALALGDSGVRNALEAHHVESYGWALSCCRRRRDEAENVLQLVYVKVLSGSKAARTATGGAAAGLLPRSFDRRSRQGNGCGDRLRANTL